jgi:radical SAM superfamily enzyme YgiQ (UPF0313 family)
VRVAIISPKAHDQRGYFNFALQPRYYRPFYELAFRFAMDRRFRIAPGQQVYLGGPSATLHALKAATPPSVDIWLMDELVHPLPLGLLADFDLVCISATTINVNRGYELLRQLRSVGVQTAIGGVHASLLPEEASEYADAVGIGEAENYWRDLLADARAKRLKRFYRSQRPVEMSAVRDYDYNVHSGEHLPVFVPVFSRGCPHQCDFCALTHLYQGYRHRPVAGVIDSIRRSKAKHVLFCDAILFGKGKSLAMELLDGLKSCCVEWHGQTSVASLQDEDVLDALAESGCVTMGMGFETLSPVNLSAMNKKQNSVGLYENTIRRLHERSIAVAGDFLFGYDADDIDCFDRTLDFIVRNGIELPEVFMFVPYPGTEAFRRMDEAGRLVTKDWSLYTAYGDTPVFQPAGMTGAVLRDGVAYVDLQCYSKKNIVRRLRNARNRNPLIWLSNIGLNRKVQGIHGRWRGDLLKEAMRKSKARTFVCVRSYSNGGRATLS